MSDAVAQGFTRRRLLKHGAAIGLVTSPALTLAIPPQAAAFHPLRGGFPLIASGTPAAVMVEPGADPAVAHVANSFANDLARVSGVPPRRLTDVGKANGPVVLIGVLGQSSAIDDLIASGKLAASDIQGEWEAFRQVVVPNPFPNVPYALVIVGSDRRGAVFGTYDVSEQIGVSPWHWFADVPVAKKADVFLPSGSRRDQPKVRYRGFFINDEAPALSEWAIEKFGGANSKMYAHVFELLLRLKGNYLWPAMWAPRAFNDDDPHNKVLADAMGVVMGTSHHEPLTRAQDEWHRNTDGGVTGGRWDYTTNRDNLRRFWRGGVERMMSKGDGRGYESLLTIGMRGDGDEAMTEGTATDLLETIVADQRQIIADVTGRPAEQQPQVWALYKEVQDYYDHGMKVPDDVTLLFSDDNWGQIRRLPPPDAKDRKGGYGIYYHFDYVSAPRNYKWINTNQIQKVWQQMDLAYERGARAIWLVNVGDIKPMEYPLSFFMAQAWNPEAMTPAALAAYPSEWASATFGADNALAIGNIVTRYGMYAARRKPELINEESFRLGPVTQKALDGGEFGSMIAEWDALEAEVEQVRARLRPAQLDAYFQMVEHPVAALANLYRLYYAVAWNRELASSNDSRANWFAAEAERLFQRDSELTTRYHQMNGGKWNGMMAQVHMNYKIWNDPTQQTLPSIVHVGGGPQTNQSRPTFLRRAAPPAGVVAVDATAYSRVRSGAGLRWTAIPALGRSGGAMLALPQGRAATRPEDMVCLDYDITVRNAGSGELTLFLAPTLDTLSAGGVASGLQVGVSVDGGPMQTLTVHMEPTGGAQDTPAKRQWADAVSDNLVRLTAPMGELRPGTHTVRIHRLSDNVVLQKLELTTESLRAG